jgi:hypothetical protein
MFRDGADTKGEKQMPDNDQKPPTDTRRFTSTAELAYARMFSGGMPEGLPPDQRGNGGPIIRAQLPVSQRERLDREINEAMKGVIADARRSNPVTGGEPLPTVVPAGAGRVASGPEMRGTGWHDPGPLQVPGGATAQAVIQAMTEVALPHGQGNPARLGKKKE